MSTEELQHVLGHPAQQRCAVAIAGLLADLRSCGSAEDYDELQRELFRHLWETESARAGVRRCLKRLRRGEKLPADAPALGNGLPHDRVDSWALEDLAYERFARQLRCVGDAIAWRATGFDRAFITAMCRNAASGPIVNKEGLNFELGMVESTFREHGHFVLLHDLTNCLRIADATEFAADGKRLLREVKKTGRRDHAQTTRMQQAIDALMDGAPLPGAPGSKVVHLETRLRAHIGAFADSLVLAHDRGVTGLVVKGGHRGLISGSLATMAQSPERVWQRTWDREKARIQRRLGLVAGTDDLVLNTGDTAARAVELAPYGIFPISPAHAAALICDLAVTEIHMPMVSLADSLEKRGLEVHFLHRGQNTAVAPDHAALHVRRGTRRLTLHGNAVAHLLIEHTNLDSLAEGLAEILDMTDPPTSPAPVFAGEGDVWV